MGVGIIIFFMTFILPRFMSIFGSVGFTHLPTMTLLLISISNVFKYYWWLMILVLILAVILFKRFQATDSRAAPD